MNGQKQSLSIPIAIIIAGALIGFGIYWTGRGSAPAAPTPKAAADQTSLGSIKPVQPDDHILGDPNSKIVLVEYSDTECPYCKEYHTTLHQIVNSYPGQIAWVWRHFPLHSRSIHESEALECAAELGGNDAFWKYTDQVFYQTNSNDTLDPAALPQIAQSIGLDVNAFNSCLSSGKYQKKIQQDFSDVTAAGAQGTPYTVIFAHGQKIPLTEGALPYESMKNIIDTVLKS